MGLFLVTENSKASHGHGEQLVPHAHQTADEEYGETGRQSSASITSP
jgi:hypothetical protein